MWDERVFALLWIGMSFLEPGVKERDGLDKWDEVKDSADILLFGVMSPQKSEAKCSTTASLQKRQKEDVENLLKKEQF